MKSRGLTPARASPWERNHASHICFAGKGGKNRRRGKNENETEKRELVFKEDGQGENEIARATRTVRRSLEDEPSLTHLVFVLRRVRSSDKNAGQR